MGHGLGADGKYNAYDHVSGSYPIKEHLYASTNPAKNLGVFDKMGSIAEGKLANLVVVDKDVNVYQTIRCGKVVFEK